MDGRRLPQSFGIDWASLAPASRATEVSSTPLPPEAMIEALDRGFAAESKRAARRRARPTTVALSLLVGSIIAVVTLLWDFF